MFLAILGHDLRTPLGAVITSSQFMLETGGLDAPHLVLTTGILRSSRRMNAMVDDLLDFTRIRLGSGIPIERDAMDMATVVGHAVEEVAASQRDRVLSCDASGDLRGEWDAARISQMLSNLLGNAVQHGSESSPIRVTVQGSAHDVELRVHNDGPAIPTSDLHGLFNPLKRLKSGEPPSRHPRNLGLGLYIAEQIVSAHGGTIDVSSSPAAGTTFTVHLPR